MSPQKKDKSLSETPFEPVSEANDETRKRKPKLYIPINEDGTLDTDPSRLRDKTVLDRARFALGMEAGAAAPPVEKPFEVPREAVPILYDALAVLIRRACHLVKFPRALNPEQREVYLSHVGYSAEFKEKATEPTAKLLEKACGESRFAMWAAKNQDAAMLVYLLSNETIAMFYRANEIAMKEWADKKEEAKTAKPNGETRGSEYRNFDLQNADGVVAQ